MTKPFYLELSIKELSKIVIYEFSYDIETWDDTSNYKLDRSLPEGKNEKVICLVNELMNEWINELAEKIMQEFARLRAKTYG